MAVPLTHLEMLLSVLRGPGLRAASSEVAYLEQWPPMSAIAFVPVGSSCPELNGRVAHIEIDPGLILSRSGAPISETQRQHGMLR